MLAVGTVLTLAAIAYAVAKSHERSQWRLRIALLLIPPFVLTAPGLVLQQKRWRHVCPACGSDWDPRS